MTLHGLDVGRWLERQCRHVVWQGLSGAQQGRLAELGIEPEAAPTGKEGAVKKTVGAGKASSFDRALAALVQY
ncbi:hypothetical protein [Kitasatospora sp. NPDC058046]|uniref:hypothetical protein n=1 Tax=Kitasatospora sp. NPDC058046 TaxID=3346312 RepID=UPI0036DBEFD9